MRQPSDSSDNRRAAALLVVLAALILAVTGSASIASIASTTKVRRQFDQRSLRADSLLVTAEAPILHWLNARSSSVVLPPQAQIPGVELLHDSIADGVDEVVLRICAFDQCGMAPIELARSGSPIRLALDQDVLAMLDRLTVQPDEKPGLDLFLTSQLSNRIGAGADLGVFPSCPKTNPNRHGEGVFTQPPRTDVPSSDPPWGNPAIGSSIATHSAGLINVNTAPIALIEAAMRASGAGGLEQIIEARELGKLALAPSVVDSGDPNRTPRLQLTSSSSAWSFRIDIQVGPLRKSWWAVYLRTGSRWECAQRLAITE